MSFIYGKTGSTELGVELTVGVIQEFFKDLDPETPVVISLVDEITEVKDGTVLGFSSSNRELIQMDAVDWENDGQLSVNITVK